MFEFQNLMNLAGDDEEKLDAIYAGLQKISNTISNLMGPHAAHGLAHGADKFISPPESNEVTIQNPDISRNKGCSSRIKSSRELSQQDRKKRKCINCGQLVRHNACTCPFHLNKLPSTDLLSGLSFSNFGYSFYICVTSSSFCKKIEETNTITHKHSITMRTMLVLQKY